jgi:hypothetical protein
MPWVDLAIAAVCGWRAMPGLIEAWRHAPFDRWGWLAFVLWLAPLAWRAGRHPGDLGSGFTSLSWAALGLLLTGSLADVNALTYGALAVALGRLMPRRRVTFVWLALAVAWMPVLGWLGAGLGPSGMTALRLALGATAGGFGLRAASPLRNSQP